MTNAKPAKDKSAMLFVVIVLLLSLVGAGAGFAVGSILQSGPLAGNSVPEAETVNKPEAAEGDGEETELIDPHSLRVVPFPPVLTTLAEPKGKWIRLEGSIMITTDAEDPPEVLAERSGEQILTYLRSVRLDQIEGPTNVLGFREDLNEMLHVLSKGQVKGILINGLVVE